MKTAANDHRTRVTKLLIRRALTELMREKPIQNITVKELCDVAQINRGTFYTHYTDIYDLLEQIEQEMFAAVEKALEPLLVAKDEHLNPVEISTEIFQCLKDHADVCTMILGDYGDKQFAYRLIYLGRDRCMETYLNYFRGASKKEIEAFYAFVSAGCIGLLQNWLADGMRAPAQEVAEMAERIMLHGIGFFDHHAGNDRAPEQDAANHAGRKHRS